MDKSLLSFRAIYNVAHTVIRTYTGLVISDKSKVGRHQPAQRSVGERGVGSMKSMLVLEEA